MNKRGSGVRRAVLLSSFLADAENKRDPDNTNHVIYAIEEPETSLHARFTTKANKCII